MTHSASSLAAPQAGFEPARVMQLAQETLEIESAALLGLKGRLGESFAQAVQAMLTVRGRVVVMGMGKSGHIGRKIAATLASTGTPSHYVHPAEASHGDLGMITEQDVMIALSNSGESAELLAIVPLVKRRGAGLIAMTGNPRSSLAQEADVHLDAGVAEEACPLGLAPTASTTAALALGDALAVAPPDRHAVSRLRLEAQRSALGRQLHPGAAKPDDSSLVVKHRQAHPTEFAWSANRRLRQLCLGNDPFDTQRRRRRTGETLLG